jgi:hypothetical protein
MPRIRIVALAAVALALLAAGVAATGGAGAAPRAHAAAAVTLNLKGGSGNRMLRACRILHHYTLYRRGTRVAFSGTVAGAGGTFTVKVKVKQCVRGRFVTRYAIKVGGRNGGFRGALRPAGRGFFFARAYFGGVKSDKQYFRGT